MWGLRVAMIWWSPIDILVVVRECWNHLFLLLMFLDAKALEFVATVISGSKFCCVKCRAFAPPPPNPYPPTASLQALPPQGQP